MLDLDLTVDLHGAAPQPLSFCCQMQQRRLTEVDHVCPAAHLSPTLIQSDMYEAVASWQYLIPDMTFYKPGLFDFDSTLPDTDTGSLLWCNEAVMLNAFVTSSTLQHIQDLHIASLK